MRICNFNRRSLLQLGAATAASTFFMQGRASAAPTSEQDLYQAAKAEGRIVFYAAANLNVSKRVVTSFKARYPGIEVEVLRLATSQLAQRFLSEHAAGDFANDVLQLADPFVLGDAAKKGWLEPLANLPEAQNYPAEAKSEHWALIGLAPHTIVLNTELVDAASAPKGWKDLLDPKWKGKIILSDPRNNLEVADWLYTMFDAYGESFLVNLRAQQPKYVPSILPGLQVLAAGDGAIVAPALHQATMVMLERGAPVRDFSPELTSGQESYAAVCAKAKHPNAARLLVNFLMTAEGQEAYCADWAASVLKRPVAGTLTMPPEYKRARYEAALAERGRLVGLLGL